MESKLTSMDEMAKLLGISKIKLFRFLRRYNFFRGYGAGLEIAPELLFNEIIVLNDKVFWVGKYKSVLSKKVYFTSKGVLWLKKIYELLIPKL